MTICLDTNNQIIQRSQKNFQLKINLMPISILDSAAHILVVKNNLNRSSDQPRSALNLLSSALTPKIGRSARRFRFRSFTFGYYIYTCIHNAHARRTFAPLYIHDSHYTHYISPTPSVPKNPKTIPSRQSLPYTYIYPHVPASTYTHTHTHGLAIGLYFYTYASTTRARARETLESENVGSARAHGKKFDISRESYLLACRALYSPPLSRERVDIYV